MLFTHCVNNVDDVYEDNKPDLVCCAHAVDHEDNKGAVFVAEASNNAEAHNQRV